MHTRTCVSLTATQSTEIVCQQQQPVTRTEHSHRAHSTRPTVLRVIVDVRCTYRVLTDIAEVDIHYSNCNPIAATGNAAATALSVIIFRQDGASLNALYSTRLLLLDIIIIMSCSCTKPSPHAEQCLFLDSQHCWPHPPLSSNHPFVFTNPKRIRTTAYHAIMHRHYDHPLRHYLTIYRWSHGFRFFLVRSP